LLVLGKTKINFWHKKLDIVADRAQKIWRRISIIKHIKNRTEHVKANFKLCLNERKKLNNNRKKACNFKVKNIFKKLINQ